jgi:hypothetical protein
MEHYNQVNVVKFRPIYTHQLLGFNNISRKKGFNDSRRFIDARNEKSGSS